MKFFDQYFQDRIERDPYDRASTRTVRVPNVAKILTHAIGLFVVLILLAVMWPFHVVNTGYRGVVTQFGEIKRIETEGLVILPPWQDIRYFNVRAEESSVKGAEGATSDTQPVAVSMVVRYAVYPDKVAEVFEKYSKTGDLSSYVQSATSDTFKAVTAQYTAPELISKRRTVASDINRLLSEKLAVYGAKVVNIDMTDFSFGKDYMAAINEKTTQEQKKLAADNRLKTVESEQKQKVAVAEADAAAVKAKADGEAYATMVNAKAQADALRLQNAAIRESKDILELKRIEVAKIEAERWNGVRVPAAQLITAPTPIANVK